MNRSALWGSFALTILLVLTGLVLIEEASSISSTTKLTATSKSPVRLTQLVEANNRFSFNLFKQLYLADPTPNIFISPQSIAIALAILRNATAGETQAEITTVLQLEQLADVDSGYSKLIKTLKTADSDVELAIANSLWINQDIAIKDKFINTTQDFYQGIATNLNFSNPTAKDTINQWVASNTNHKISEIVDRVSPADAAYLINAIYFKGSWTNKFDPDATALKFFTLTSGKTKAVKMMSQTGDYRYYENQEFQAVRLPYGAQAELGMYIFLPQSDSSLEQLNQQLNLDNWQEWLSQMRSQPGNVTLPQFKLEYDTELNDVLSLLGMQQVFDASKADLSPLSDDITTAVDAVKHKAIIEVNEEGTEAAGVTSIGIRITSAMPQQPFNFQADRPFFFAIRDDVTQSILFMGNVVEP